MSNGMFPVKRNHRVKCKLPWYKTVQNLYTKTFNHIIKVKRRIGKEFTGNDRKLDSRNEKPVTSFF